MSTAIVALESVTLARGSKTVYADLSIQFGLGVTALLGPNGAGKTTLIEGLVAPLRLRRGHVLLDGAEVPQEVGLRSFLASIGHMPQHWRFFPGFTVLESVEYAGWLKGLPSKVLRERAQAAVAWVDLTAEQHVKVRRLSGGMQQRVGLAETFVHDPRLVLLDEPTVGLDPAQRALFRSFVQNRSADRAVVLSTHLTDDVAALADRVVVIDAGRVLFDGSVAELESRGRAVEGAASAVEAGYLAVVGGPAPSGRG